MLPEPPAPGGKALPGLLLAGLSAAPEPVLAPLLPEPAAGAPDALCAEFFDFACIFFFLECGGLAVDPVVPEFPLAPCAVSVCVCASIWARCSTAAIFCGSVLSRTPSFCANAALESDRAEIRIAMDWFFKMCSSFGCGKTRIGKRRQFGLQNMADASPLHFAMAQRVAFAMFCTGIRLGRQRQVSEFR